MDRENVQRSAGERVFEDPPQGTNADRHALECGFSGQSCQTRSSLSELFDTRRQRCFWTRMETHV